MDDAIPEDVLPLQLPAEQLYDSPFPNREVLVPLDKFTTFWSKVTQKYLGQSDSKAHSEAFHILQKFMEDDFNAEDPHLSYRGFSRLMVKLETLLF